MKTTAQIRSAFLDYFSGQDHRVVASSSLVPANDPTLLFTNAGMVQFKDVFVGADRRDYQRAVSSQRCVRAGGKHNDLDQVGHTARHHTFFEMLGNFSFGDYFKSEAIRYAWAFLTDELKLDPDRLLVTVYHDDDEAWKIWNEEIGLAEDRIIRIGDKPGGKAYDSDNFWAMGETGPCGPCTEIFYDHGPDVTGGPPGSPDEDGDRFIEIWNIVFMQYDRSADGSLKPLPAPSVDTGMGLERIAAVLQGVHSNYEIDLFQALIKAAAELTHCRDLDHDSLKVIADHIRATAFLISDGVMPSNEGRGYVLRRIIRRALRHGYKLGQDQPFFSGMVSALVDEMGEAYPELAERQQQIESILEREEARFAETLSQGMQLLEGVMDDLESDEIPGATAFKLYDTYGFPVDLTADIAREHDLGVDEAGFEAAMQAQRERARAATRFEGAGHVDAEVFSSISPTRFEGYQVARIDQAEVLAILVEGASRDQIEAGQSATIILDRTPFYGESGGQVGDTGTLTSESMRFEVEDTVKLAGAYHGHQGQLQNGSLAVGATVAAEIDSERRSRIVHHHSATHLLHAALRAVLGEHVEQKGSLVAPDRLRFDFSHFEPVGRDQLQQIENLVNQQIRGNAAARIQQMSYDEAIDAGAVALFGEKYDDEVRVLEFGEFSIELCGGTHVDRVGDIGLFKILSETGISAGVRRIEAVAGERAVTWTQNADDALQHLSAKLKTGVEALPERLDRLLDQQRELERKVQSLEARLASGEGKSIAAEAEQLGNVTVLASQVSSSDAEALRTALDQLKSELGRSVIVLGAGSGGKVRLIAGVSKDLTDQVKAGELVNYVAGQVGGRGGGRPDMAQAGGSQPEHLSKALQSVKPWVEARLSAE